MLSNNQTVRAVAMQSAFYMKVAYQMKDIEDKESGKDNLVSDVAPNFFYRALGFAEALGKMGIHYTFIFTPDHEPYSLNVQMPDDRSVENYAVQYKFTNDDGLM